jgi:hypothetical protein
MKALLPRICVLACALSALSGAVPTDAHAEGRDFINEARAIFRAASCGTGELPPGIDAAAVASHCRQMDCQVELYREHFVSKAVPFFAAVMPGLHPRTVVVPFGGSDLLPALIVYPDAKEITTISLESAGDPRRLAHATPAQLLQALVLYRSNVGYMLCTNDSSNDSMRGMERGAVPNQLAFSLTALQVLGYEPVSLKYFRIEEDGSLHYLSDEDIAGLEGVRGARLKGSWIDTDFSVAFRNMELAFRKKGGGRTIIHRHIAFNLDNGHFNGSGLRRHLEKKGRFAVMIKGASYLPWFESFSEIRNLLLDQMSFCVSDSTGFLPEHASAAGFEQIVYGKFSGAFLENDGGSGAESMRALFRSQTYRPLDFRFGYSDIHRLNHLIITRRR